MAATTIEPFVIEYDGYSFVIREVTLDSTTTRVFGAFYEGAKHVLPMGVLTVDTDEDTVELVYVSEEYRSRGIAKKLLEYAREATGCAIAYGSPERTWLGSRWCRENGLKLQGQYRRMGQRDVNGIAARLMLRLWGAR